MKPRSARGLRAAAALVIALGWVCRPGVAQAKGSADRKLQTIARKGQALIGELKLDGAHTLLEEAARGSTFKRARRSSRALLLVTLGWARSELGDLTGGEAAFRRAIEQDPKVQLPASTSPKLRATLERIRASVAVATPRSEAASKKRSSRADAQSRKRRPRRARSPAEPAPSKPDPSVEPMPTSSSPPAPGLPRPSPPHPRPSPGAEPPQSPPTPLPEPEAPPKREEPLAPPPDLKDAWSEPPERVRMPGLAGTATAAASTPTSAPVRSGPDEGVVWGLAIAGTVAVGIVVLVVVVATSSECAPGTCPDQGLVPWARF